MICSHTAVIVVVVGLVAVIYHRHTKIHKKGHIAETKNYRPVSLSSQVAKLMERLVITENDIISCRQHGLQSHCSCVTQLIECY